jgi:hypothetical protein
MGDQALMVVGFAWASPDDGGGQRVVARLERAAPPDARIIDGPGMGGQPVVSMS